jgi:hypothetical protein
MRSVLIVGIAMLSGLLGCNSSDLAPDNPLRSDTDSLKWELINSIDASVDVRFFDETYGDWYPSRSTYYSLNGRRQDLSAPVQRQREHLFWRNGSQPPGPVLWRERLQQPVMRLRAVLLHLQRSHPDAHQPHSLGPVLEIARP